jgi:hypothetical protein
MVILRQILPDFVFGSSELSVRVNPRPLVRQAPTTPPSERRPSRGPPGAHPPDQARCVLISAYSCEMARSRVWHGDMNRCCPCVRSVRCGPILMTLSSSNQVDVPVFVARVRCGPLLMTLPSSNHMDTNSNLRCPTPCA